MKILVTGTTGFIGKNLIKELEANKHFVYSVTRTTDFNEIFAKEKFDGIIHLASLFLNQHKTEDIKNLIDSNILLGTTLLDYAAKNDVKWFINTGTFWQHYKNKDYSPVNLYAATKQAFEDIARYYIETNPINFVTIKICDTFGPGDTRPKVFNLFSKISLSGETLEMSPGKQTIDINYIGNIISGYMHVINLLEKDTGKKMQGKVYAIKAQKRVSLNKLASIFEKTTGLKLNIKWGGKPYRPREVMVPWTKGKSIPNWRPEISIEEGIIETFRK